MHVADERVVEMMDPRPSPKCKDSAGDSGCDISFDRSQVTDFIVEQMQGDQQAKQQKIQLENKAQLEAMQSVTVLFQQPAAGSEDDEDEPSLPEQVQDLFADESTNAFVIAFVSPAAVQKLLGTSDVNSVSDMRSALVANSHFADLLSKLGQVLSRYTGIRGIVDIQGKLLK